MFDNPSTYYGKEVTGYTVADDSVKDAVSTWRIFHSDGDNIYLIADDYIHYDYVPNSINGTALNKGGTNYRAYFTNILSDYSSGSGAIASNNPARKWLSYLSKQSSTNNNMKAVAYMMDTSENVWGKYAGGYAEYAIGGPTLEMFCSSYNRTHQSKQMYSTVYDSVGYQVKWATDTSYSGYISGMATSNDYNNIYVIGSNTNAYAMWLTSPSALTTDYVMGAYYGGLVYDYTYYNTSHCGFRPLVCLKSNIQLVENGSGGYSIT